MRLVHSAFDAPHLDDPLRTALAEEILELQDDERQSLAALPAHEETFKAGEILLITAEPHDGILVVKSGFLGVVRDTRDGRRQILQLAIPGDVICCEPMFRESSTCEVFAISEASIIRVKPNDIMSMGVAHPRIGMTIMWLGARDTSILAERLLSVARRSAYERIAHFFVETAERLEERGLMKGPNFRFPISKVQLSDLMGMTSVHTYRILRSLSEDKLLYFHDGHCEIPDITRLQDAAGYDAAYWNGKPT